MRPELWGLTVNSRNHLALGGCDLVDLAQRHGTPVHVVDEERLCKNYARFTDAFSRHFPDAKYFYSYKTNCIPGVLQRLHQEGCGAEVTSAYELWLALKLGVEPTEIVYNGVIKSKADLGVALDAGVGLINIDSRAECEILIDLAKSATAPVDVGIRMFPPKGWRTQFGLELDGDRVMDICRTLASGDRCRVVCLHAHIGSGLRSSRDYAILAQSMGRLARRIHDELGISVRYLDLGGGFGVPSVKTLSIAEVARYKLLNRPPRSPDPRACPSLEDFAATIAKGMGAVAAGHEWDRPALWFEPGRVITSDAQVLLVTVRDVKQRSNGRSYAITDGGMQNIAFPLSYEYHHCFAASRAKEPAHHRYFVTGPLCSPQDILYRNWRLPSLSVGDVLAIMDSGAYFTSFANNFSFPRPAVVMAANGVSKVLRGRETFEQMTAMDELEVS